MASWLMFLVGMCVSGIVCFFIAAVLIAEERQEVHEVYEAGYTAGYQDGLKEG